jgi:hypothetical protein
MNEGYIKLYRKTVNSKAFQNEGLLKVWIWCLLKANHKECWVSIKVGRITTEVLVKPGQFVFGRYSAAKELKMSPSTVWKRIKKLECMRNLNTDSNSNYTIITIVNWETYQGQSKKGDSKGDHRVTTGEHRQECSKNGEEETNTAFGDAEGEFYTTKKGRKLKGKRLEQFNLFWEVFNYKLGKAEAADAWLNIPNFTDELFKQKIISAAKHEAEGRSDLRPKGKTPKMAQGWITGRRWEDEMEPRESDGWEKL